MIDASQLKSIFNNYQESESTVVKGKVINVVNQIPYNCFINNAEQQVEKLNLSLSCHQKDNFFALVMEEEEEDSTPISHLEKRRRSSNVALLEGTNKWHLTARRGHSAMYAALDSLKMNYKTLYIGGTGIIRTNDDDEKLPIETKRLSQEEKESLADLLKSKHDMIPLFLDDQTSFGHYEGYCKKVLWPLMHYLMWSDKVNEVFLWNDYVKVNELFAQEVIKNYEKGDIIWVHDYHLLLVPQMVRHLLPNAPIGLFVHTPFPSSEIFRCLPHRKEVLDGMLSANLLGFQTYNYARHFASNCTRILGYEYTPSGILANGIFIQLGIYSIGIDVERTRYHCHRPGVLPKAKAMRERFSGKKIIIGRDKLDPVKGVLQKLEAFELFLNNYPQWRDKVVLIQVTSPGVIDSHNLETKAAEIVARINGKFGSLEFTPANFYNQHIDRDEYYALLQVADIGLVTPVIDGMNTSSFEFIVAQEHHHSPLILSEFTGTANSMGAAVIVNPWDFSEVARAIAECLSMSQEEKYIKYQQLHQFVTSHTASYWARSLVKGILNVPKNIWSTTTVPLDVSRVKTEYQNKRKRAFFFDYDGTLVPICTDLESAKPTQQVLDTLTRLSQDVHNNIWIISGRTQKYLEDWLGHIPNLGLSAEHGCFIREPKSQIWVSVLDNLDSPSAWKDEVRPIYEYYTERTPGSFIEEKKSSLIWHYRKADPKYGEFQAMEMQNHLEQNIVGKLPVECLTGKMTVEIRPSLVNKGIIIKRALTQNPDTDFVLCAGDDKTDEDMFRALERIELSGIVSLVQFKIIVGSLDNRKTMANWMVDSSHAFVQILAQLSAAGAR